MKKYISVIGGINIDIKGVSMDILLPETSNPGSVYLSPGGVARNIAHNLAMLGIPVYLFGAVGNDGFGTRIIAETRKAGVNVECIQILNEQRTGIYLSILNDSSDLAVAISDMGITHFVDIDYLYKHQEIVQNSGFVILETNLDAEILASVLELCRRHHIPCLVEPVSVEKAKKLHNVDGDFDYITPNRAELEALCHRKIEDRHQLEDACAQLSNKCQHILVTLGEDGVYYYNRKHRAGKFYPPFKTQIVDPNGAGDAFVAGLVCGLFRDFAIDDCIQLGTAAARLTLQSKDTVSTNMSFAACSSLVCSKSRNEVKWRFQHSALLRD